MTRRKFSVLLPTRDRLDLAKDAIETVRRQSFADWELIVADNCSGDNVGEFVASLADPRIICIRSDAPIPVTENWNRAMDASSGDYVVMLGDDDGLVPGYFERLLEVIHRLEDPDFIYHGAYHFAFPGVLSGLPAGGLTDVTTYQVFLRGPVKVKLLERDQAEAVARAALDMRAHYGFNMQHFLFSRRFLTRMAKFGPFFQGPFPDFYAANISMLTADRIGLLAEPMVIIGISPKSYGYYHFNNKEKGGISFLNGASGSGQTDDPWRSRLLPGTNMNSSWLVSVALIPERLNARTDLRANVGRYRRLQIMYNLKRAALGELPAAGLRQLWPRMIWRERAFAVALKVLLLPAYAFTGRFRTKWARLMDILAAQYPPVPPDRPQPIVGNYKTILDVYKVLAGAAASSARRCVTCDEKESSR